MLSYFSFTVSFQDMERAITRDLAKHILQFSAPILKAVNFAAELDWYTGLKFTGNSSLLLSEVLCFLGVQYKFLIWVLFYSSLSLAFVARQNNYVRPILTTESMLDIRNGRLELSRI